MKTRRLVTIASILAIAIMSVSISQVVNAAEDPGQKFDRKVAHLTFDEAIQNDGILKAMYEQIQNHIIPQHWPYYTARIIYRGASIFVRGTIQQWNNFLNLQRIYFKTRQN
jgi:hypothetical protein